MSNKTCRTFADISRVYLAVDQYNARYLFDILLIHIDRWVRIRIRLHIGIVSCCANWLIYANFAVAFEC